MRALLFSDLHYSRQTKETCLQVLRFVAKTAKQRNVSVYFLGDFYDKVYKDGKLPVDLLDEMLVFFASDEWGVETVMIPGNHDYYDSAEEIHGLTPFQYLSGFTVHNAPHYHDGQLFLPFCRDPQKIQTAIERHSSLPPTVIFGHLDVIGARMNSAKLSTKGCSHEMFQCPTYSGHYHSRSKKGNVTYIGSPYQVHLSEAGDQKTLLVIDCSNGAIVEDVPIDIGRKHYKINAVDIERLPTLKHGDRVVIEDDSRRMDEMTRYHIDALRDRGIVVETKAVSTVVKEKPRLETTDDKPMELWERYLKLVRCHADVHPMSLPYFKAIPQTTPPIINQTNVVFEQMEISNFGPFVGNHQVNFHTGMTLITGKYDREGAADSNGVGKSLFSSGAFLWVCTGRTDPRFGATMQVSNGIISFERKSTYVILNGTVNGAQFIVSRHMTQEGKKHTHSLNFHIDDADVGNNTLKMTQERINRLIFGIVSDATPASTLFDFLTRTTIWTQRNCPRFLDSSDAASKNELSMIANIDYWHDIDKHLRSEHTKGKQDVRRANDLLEVYTNQLHEEERRKSALEFKILEWESEHAQKILHLQRQLQAIRLPYPVPSRVDVHAKEVLLQHKQDALQQITQVVPEHQFKPSESLQREWITTTYHNEEVRKKLEKVKVSGLVCDTCLSEVQPEQVEDRKRALEGTIKSLSGLKRRREDELKTYVDLKQSEMESAAATLREEIATLTRDIAHGVKMNASVQVYNQQNAKRSALDIQITHLQASKCPFDLRPQLDRLETARQKKGEYEALERTTTRKIEDLSVLLKHTGPCGIQSFILEATTKHLVSLVHYISNDQSFDIRVSDREKLVKTFNGNPLSALSGGEFQKLSVACFLAYRQLLQNTTGWQSNLLILDEADVYLDQTACHSLFQMIKRVGGSTLVISHTNAMHRDMTLFEHHLELERDGNGSRKRKRV